MLTDVCGYIRRNVKNWKAYEIKKSLKEINQTKVILEKELQRIEGGYTNAI